MMVCIVLIWFLLAVLQESSRKLKNKISNLVFAPTPLPLFGSIYTFGYEPENQIFTICIK